MSEEEKSEQIMEEAPDMSAEEMGLIEANYDQLFRPDVRPDFLWGKCTNRTGEMLGVYGPKNLLYCLPPGRSTPNNWDCDGFFVPNNRIANQLTSNVKGPVAVKYFDGIHFEPTRTGTHYHCGGNQGVYKPGQINWPIPNLPYNEVVKGCKQELLMEK